MHQVVMACAGLPRASKAAMIDQTPLDDSEKARSIPEMPFRNHER